MRLVHINRLNFFKLIVTRAGDIESLTHEAEVYRGINLDVIR